MFIGGLDLGQAGDPSALVILQIIDPAANPLAGGSVFHLRYLHRFPLGDSYPDIVDDVHATWTRFGLGGDDLLCVDYTGVGRPVVDLFLRRAEIPIRPITITGGGTVTDRGDGWYNVPKKDLAAVMQILLRRRRLQIAKGLKLADLLMKELQNFRVKITTSGNETFEAWREGDHDDLVLATALPCWLAERTVLGAFDVGRDGAAGDPRDLTSQAPGGVFQSDGPGGGRDGYTTLWQAGR